MEYIYKGHTIELQENGEYIIRTDDGIIIHEGSLDSAKDAIDNIYG